MKRVAIIGAGLSGLTLAHLVSRDSDAHVVIFEEGMPYQERVDDHNSNILMGEGGAGTIYGGKLCYPPASNGVWKRSSLKIDKFNEFVTDCLSPILEESLLPEYDVSQTMILSKNKLLMKNYQSKLLEKAKMQRFVTGLIRKNRKQGVEINTNTKLIGFKKCDGEYILNIDAGVEGTREESYDTLVLATGRSSSGSIIKLLRNSADIRLQNPDLGIRITTDYTSLGLFSEIGSDVKLKTQINDTLVRTFCVCAGGSQAKVHLDGTSYYDGHFGDHLTNRVNFGILAKNPHIFGYEGAMLYCSYLQKYIDSTYSLKEFMEISNTMIPGDGPFSEVLKSITAFLEMMLSENLIDGNLNRYEVSLPSVDRLNPIISTDGNFQTKSPNLFVVGDAVGISRGFIQSMWSGYCAGRYIADSFKSVNQKVSVIK